MVELIWIIKLAILIIAVKGPELLNPTRFFLTYCRLLYRSALNMTEHLEFGKAAKTHLNALDGVSRSTTTTTTPKLLFLTKENYLPK